jgi:N-succinyldiaminopimelate aminotransferase
MFAERFVPFGTTIFSEMTKLANEKGAINLAQGFPDFDAPSEMLEEAVQALRNGENQYARSMGHMPLAKTLSEKINRDYGLDADPYREIIVTSGATEGIASTFLGLLNPGDEVVFFEPHYDSYPACVAIAGATARFCTLKFPDFHIDFEELEGCFSEKTRVLFINTPHNPTGKVFTEEELERLAELCIRRDVLVVTDEVYEHITYDGAEHIPMAKLPGMRERTLTISGAGKTFSMTGWRIGWISGPADLIEAVQRAHQYVTFAPATPLQHALARGIAAVGDDYFRTLRRDYTERRDLLIPVLRQKGLKVAIPKGAYYVLADFSHIWEGDDKGFVHHLIDHVGVAAIPPSSFYTAAPEEGQRLVRFAFCKRIDTLRQAADRLANLRPGLDMQ